ncbi:pimeloyl-ACP methyl ester carboxylesterase [Methylohalomonas lacus]|uniref:Pimeloyl-ACP methyl ester carboxylesterase n=1 Tax=Methylohalomonas lacus TaxID=398773 RepID=A0AAE3HKI0_9GAMM|nr:alpha/beta hydrolase family protein [Methylohalomonas lacus]MCS3902113.1 pimeloyl-ACP methyl ester carboxylesterase [Methylohalomonas lacus]
MLLSGRLLALLRLFVLACSLLQAPGGFAASEREQQLAERLAAQTGSGEQVWLTAGDEPFLALHNAVLGALPRRAVLLVHNMGGHADWPEVIAPLRRGLTELGWSTLSLQMPLLAAGALADDYGRTLPAAGRRIDSGIDYLRDQGYGQVVLLGYGFGASQALAYLAENDTADGLILVGILAREFLQPAPDLPELLGRLDQPVLDVYGRNDFPEVIERAQARRRAATGAYSQRAVAGADHYFTGREQRLLAVLGNWLNETFAVAGDTSYDGQADGSASRLPD